MHSPEIPSDEHQRLAALHALQLLDTLPEERFDRITRLAQRLFGTSSASLTLVDEQRQWSKSMQGPATREAPRTTSFCGHTILGNGPFVVADASRDSRFSANPMVTSDPHIRFYAGCPIHSEGHHKIGTLCILDQQPRTFSLEDAAMLEDLARMAEQDILSHHLACTDELSRLANRRGFMAMASNALNLCRRLKKPSTLLFFDLDRFKDINDQHGHAEGDRALKIFADLLLTSFRDSDVIGRLGGDEFAVLLTNNDGAHQSEALGRLEKALQECNKTRGWNYPLAYSVGSVSWKPQSKTTITELIEQADQLMYARKRARRGNQPMPNRADSAPESDSAVPA